jgi:hypothetical protein
MPRGPRTDFPGAVHHVVARTLHEVPFFHDDLDIRAFLGLLASLVVRCCWNLYAYCVLPRGYELVVETSVANLGEGLREVNGGHARQLNSRYRRTGHVFAERFRSNVLETELDLIHVCRDVVLRPVSLGLCTRAADWPHSSYGATAGRAPTPPFLSPDRLLLALSRTGHGSGLRSYASFVATAEEDLRARRIRTRVEAGPHGVLPPEARRLRDAPLVQVPP